MTLTPRSTAISLLVAIVCGSGAFAQAAQAERAATQATGQNWQDLTTAHAKSLVGADNIVINGKSISRGVKARKYRAVALDKRSMARLVAGAPHERSVKKSESGFIVSLPFPDGGYQRFRLVESPVMEDGLAAKHPEIKTYAGRGVDDATATLRMDISPLGLHASVRSAKGNWYVDPLNTGNDTVHATYFTRDAENTQGALREGAIDVPQLMLDRSFYHAGDTVEVRGAGFEPNSSVTVTVRGEGDSAPTQSFVAGANEEGVISLTFPADPTGNTGSYEVAARDGANDTTSSFQVVADGVNAAAVAGITLKTYRLALVTDPSYAAYFGAANVTAAKVTLINRVSQIYEDETSIKLVLINDTDKLNLNTDADMTGANGPCGGSACYTAAQASGCVSSTLTRNRVVAGLLAGASNFDVGHIGFGLNGGGVASLGVVGGASKAQGCTGIPTPVGDFFAVDYVAHELGHQFAGNHTFNGTISNCSTSNRNAGTSVEPGSGSSIMAYAGICGTDNLQPHSDPYWSQRSFDEITTYTSGVETNVNEVQMGVLSNFNTNGQQFQLQYNGNNSPAIIRGTNYTVAGLKAAVETLTGGTVTASAVGDTAFTLTFTGALAATDVAPLTMVNLTGGATGYVGEIVQGGQTKKRGRASDTGNTAPVVTVPASSYTIPVRTPFALTGSATDVDAANTITYMWEQNDRGATGTANGTGLITQPKLNGPLFRQFGTRAVVSAADTITYGSPGENKVSTDPTRVFPDMAQILANNTNAATGACPTASPTPTADQINCFSEYLPTAAYVGTANVNSNPASLNFRLTARDGKGGIGNATVQLVLAPTAGPFRVTSAATPVSYDVGSTQTITWDVANTNVAPVNTANVKISLSLDGGATFGTVLAASTPNTGSASVVMPATASTTARLKIEALGNVFFDVSRSNFTVRALGDLNSDGAVDCADLAIVKSSLNKRTGQAGFDARADLNKDGIVNVLDLTAMTRMLPAGTVCK